MSQADIEYIKEYRNFTPGTQLFDSLELALKYIKSYRTHKNHHIIQLRSTYRKVHGVYKDVFRVDFQCNCGGSFIVEATGRRMGCPFRGKIVQYKNTQHWRLIFEVSDQWQKNYQEYLARKNVQIMFAINSGKTNRQILDQLTQEARLELEQDSKKKKITDKLLKQTMPLEDYSLEDIRRRMAQDYEVGNESSFVDLGIDTTLAEIDSDQTEDEDDEENENHTPKQNHMNHHHSGLSPKSTFKRRPLQEISSNTPSKRLMTKPTPMPMSIDHLAPSPIRSADEAFSLAIAAFFQSWTASGYRPDQIPHKYNPFLIPTEQHHQQQQLHHHHQQQQQLQQPTTPLHHYSQNHHNSHIKPMPPLQPFSASPFASFDHPSAKQTSSPQFW